MPVLASCLREVAAPGLIRVPCATRLRDQTKRGLRCSLSAHAIGDMSWQARRGPARSRSGVTVEGADRTRAIDRRASDAVSLAVMMSRTATPAVAANGNACSVPVDPARPDAAGWSTTAADMTQTPGGSLHARRRLYSRRTGCYFRDTVTARFRPSGILSLEWRATWNRGRPTAAARESVGPDTYRAVADHLAQHAINDHVFHALGILCRLFVGSSAGR